MTGRTVQVPTSAGVLSGLATASPHEGRPLVVALHGGSYDAGYFDETAAPGHSLLSTFDGMGFRVVALDRPGYGAATVWSPLGLDFEKQLDVLEEAVLALAGSDPVFLVGHSIGGMLAVGLAARPRLRERVAGIALSGAGVEYHEHTLHAFRNVPVVEGRVVRDPQTRRYVMFGPDWTVDERVLDRDASLGAEGPSAPIVEFRDAQRWPELIDVWGAGVACPVHYVLAEYDIIWKARADDVARARSCFTGSHDVRAYVQPGAGHSLDQHLVAPAYHARLGAFFREIEVLARRP